MPGFLAQATSERQKIILSAGVKKVTFKNRYFSKPYVIQSPASNAGKASKGWTTSGITSTSVHIVATGASNAVFHVLIEGLGWPSAYPVVA